MVLKELWLLLIVLEIDPNYHMYISDSLIETVKNACNLGTIVQNDLKVCARRIDSFASRVICILLLIFNNFLKLSKMSYLLHIKTKTFVYVMYGLVIFCHKYVRLCTDKILHVNLQRCPTY